MHSAWKAWQQRGSKRRRSCCSNFDRHTAQSAPPPEAAERRVTEEKENAGREPTMEGEALSDDIGFLEEDSEADEGEIRRRKRLR